MPQHVFCRTHQFAFASDHFYIVLYASLPAADLLCSPASSVSGPFPCNPCLLWTSGHLLATVTIDPCTANRLASTMWPDTAATRPPDAGEWTSSGCGMEALPPDALIRDHGRGAAVQVPQGSQATAPLRSNAGTGSTP